MASALMDMHLVQSSANCTRWAKSGLPASLVKFYCNTDMPVHFHIVYNCFRATPAELSSWDRALMAHKASNSFSGLLQKVCQLAFYL